MQQYPISLLFWLILIGLWLFGWLPIKPPSWLINGPPYDPIVAHPELAQILYIKFLIVAFGVLILWIWTYQFNRKLHLQDLAVMFRANIASKHGAVRFVSIAAVPVFVVWAMIQGAPWDSYIVRILTLLAFCTFIIVMRPPTVVVLGSDSLSGEVLKQVSQHIRPLRTVSLLHRDLNDIDTATHDIERTIRDSDWFRSVCNLMEISPLIIVDGRKSTLNLTLEISYIVKRELYPKCVLIHHEDGRVPALDHPNSLNFRTELASFCSANQLQDVIARYKTTKWIHFASPEELAMRGVGYAVQQRNEDAIRLLEHAYRHLENTRDKRNVLDQLASCFSIIGDHQKAEYYWSLLHRAGIDQPKYWSNRALCLLRAGDERRALNAFEKRLEMDNHGPSRRAIQLIENGRGNTLISRDR